jgi:SynChlorMet cassette radical SAM/SPASM protein ScmF
MADNNNKVVNGCDKNVPNLTSLYINPTKYCNLCCKHCWIAPPNREKVAGGDGEISVKEMIEVIKVAKELGLLSVKLTGGEPLLRPDLKGLLEFCSVSDIGVWIETNGTLITEDTVQMLKDTSVSFISVSLDSSIEDKHDAFRGRIGTFKQTVQGIKRLVKEGFTPQIIMTLYRENINDFGHFLSLMKQIGVDDVKVNIISCIGRGHEMQLSGMVPTVREVLDFREELKSLKKSFNGYVFLDIPAAFKSLEDLKKRNFGKCAVKNILGLLSDGRVSLCGVGYLDEKLVFGNITGNTAALKDIWLHNPTLKRIREDIPLKLEGVCAVCVFKNMCMGSCRAEAYYEGGDLITAPSRFCQEAYEEGLFPKTRLVPETLRV